MAVATQDFEMTKEDLEFMRHLQDEWNASFYKAWDDAKPRMDADPENALGILIGMMNWYGIQID